MLWIILFRINNFTQSYISILHQGLFSKSTKNYFCLYKVFSAIVNNEWTLNLRSSIKSVTKEQFSGDSIPTWTLHTLLIPGASTERGLPSQCSILISSVLPSHFEQSQTGSCVYVCPGGCAIHAKWCTAQPGGIRKQVFHLCTPLMHTGIQRRIRMIHQCNVLKHPVYSLATLSGHASCNLS